MSATGIDVIIDRFRHSLTGEDLPARAKKFRSYAITNFRGGIGKSTLSFNLAFEMSKQTPCLFLDTCSQRNFSQSVFGDYLYQFPKTLYDALVVEMTNSGSFPIEEVSVSVNAFSPTFLSNKHSYMLPGSTELFLFPSLLYSQLAQYAQLGEQYQKDASARTLLSLKRIIDKASKISKPEKILVDTSPFFGGATHLSWTAVDAIIIPVRVDQNSIEALRLTLRMLRDEKMDFHKFNKQAGLTSTPSVHAIAMTHCGWNRRRENTPDNSTLFFVQKALETSLEFKELFSEDDLTNCFYILDDFHSAGRISGKQRIPISKLESGQKYVVDGQRLDVNPSVDRYKKEIQNLAAAL
jgi:chromosome partitioning protein